MESKPNHLQLQQGELQLTLDPQHGGSIREFSWRGRPILRPTPEAALFDPMQFACFPMVPYANRIAGGQFVFGAHVVQLRPNWDKDPHPLHGQGWCSPWSVVRATTSAATLMFDGGGDEWPWRYRAQQHCELRASTLKIELSVENLASSPMPVMLGLHPYFCDASQALLKASVPRVWQTNDESLPIAQIATPRAWSFDAARPITSVPLDHCFVDWNGRATIRWPDRSVSLQATNCRYLHVYAPRDQDFFCLEPQSAPAGVLNRGSSDVPVLQPGERYAIALRFEFRVL
jgi:aldose 1-epimerase